jgi:hypothetical protein
VRVQRLRRRLNPDDGKQPANLTTLAGRLLLHTAEMLERVDSSPPHCAPTWPARGCLRTACIPRRRPPGTLPTGISIWCGVEQDAPIQ